MVQYLTSERLINIATISHANGHGRSSGDRSIIPIFMSSCQCLELQSLGTFDTSGIASLSKLTVHRYCPSSSESSAVLRRLASLKPQTME